MDGWLASIPPDRWDEHLFTNYRQLGVKTTVPGMFFSVFVLFWLKIPGQVETLHTGFPIRVVAERHGMTRNDSE